MIGTWREFSRHPPSSLSGRPDRQRQVDRDNPSKTLPAKRHTRAPTTANPGYPSTPEKEDLDLKSLVMILLEEHKKDINKYLKEIQGMMTKLEALTVETQKSLKEIQENMGEQIEANKEEKQKSLKEMQEKLGHQAEDMKEETKKIYYRNRGKHKQTSEGTEQNHPGSKNGSRNN